MRGYRRHANRSSRGEFILIFIWAIRLTWFFCLQGKAAGMRVCVTKSIYSEDEDFTGADAVFDCIGDDGDERFGFEDLTTPGSFWQGDD